MIISLSAWNDISKTKNQSDLMNSKIFILCLCMFCVNSINSQSYTLVTTVKTPKGSTVQNTGKLTSSDISYSSAQLASLTQDIHDNFNGATLIDVPTYKYNCHAYAWHVSEGGDKVWIGYYDKPFDKPIAEDVYWEDGSYIEVSESQATKVSYHETGDHSAIRLSNEWYQSKWGQGPLVKHHPNDVPLLYNPSMTKNTTKNYQLCPSKDRHLFVDLRITMYIIFQLGLR